VDPEEAEAVRILTRHGEHRTHHEAASAGPLEAGHELVAQARGHLVEDGAVQVLLRGEVPVDDQPGDAGLGRDVVHRGRGEAAPGEGGGGGAEQLRLPLPTRQQLAGGLDSWYTREYTLGRQHVGGEPVSTLQLDYTEDEILASHDYAAPLYAGGVRCHGGFDDDGRYVSPRTRNRVPAIAAWQAHRAEQFGTPLLDVPLETWPAHYPSLPQARFLLEQGVREPIVATLTRIGTVEGFGGLIRHTFFPDLQSCFDEDVRGTAMSHLQRGLYEAHARDEAGFEDEGGHKQMWFAARDVAFENPVTEDETNTMLQRMGIPRPAQFGTDVAAMRAAAQANRLWPEDVDLDLELTVERMVRLLLIEISAFHTFAWAEALLADETLVASEGEAARLVSYIRADETPHVEYLKTVLTEMRDRTFVGASRKKYAGTDLVNRTWDRAVAESTGPRHEEGVRIARIEITHACSSRSDGADIVARFDELGVTEAAA
jgi:hypothetical protein